MIRLAHAGIPDDASLDERTRIIDAAYPFGQRKYHPYKMWLIERREYLEAYGYKSRGKPKHGSQIVAGQLVETPLERMMRRGGKT